MRCLVYAGFAPGSLAGKVDKVRAAIERDDLRSADVKRLANGPYCRAKLDASSRLLLQFMRHEGETLCLFLEVIRHHAYDKSRFLRGARVDEDKLQAITQPTGADCPPMRFVHPTRPEFHLLDKPLSLDDAQDKALRQPAPQVLVGSAGSGKTALLLQRLRQTTGTVAYVTESRWLAEMSRSLYVAFDGAPEDQEANFLSYQQLLETVHVPDGRAVEFRDFSAFFARHQAKLRFATAHAVYEELRGVLTAEPEGPLTQQVYLDLGVRQSLFSREQRAAIYALFERYLVWLRQADRYEPNLIAHAQLGAMTPTYDFVVVDEVQDLTNAQLALVLAALKRPGNFVLAGDANQIVHPNYFSWASVKSLFWRGVGEVKDRQVQMLTASYRNSAEVTAVANDILRLKNLRFGSIDKESNQLMVAIGGARGTVASFAAGSKAVQDLNERTRRSTQAAVIVLRDEHKAEARRHFKTPLLFSIREVKGLEYETIILYRMVAAERQIYADLAGGVTQGQLAIDELAYRRARDKSDKSLELTKFFVNALYVAVTRAVRDVILIEDDTRHPLLRLLNVAQAQDAGGIESRRASAREWQREAQRLQAQGKHDQAESIRRDVLRLVPVPWRVFGAERLPKLMGEAVDPDKVATKLRRQMLEFAYFHDEAVTVGMLEEATGLAQVASYAQDRPEATRIAIRRSLGKGHASILRDTERYGVDHRVQVGLTPLMLAAYTGDVALVEALCDRGADKTARDHLGRQAINWGLRGAYDGFLQPADQLGTVYDLVAPASFDIKVDGRMHQIGREQGEYFVFQLIVARLSSLYRADLTERRAMSSGHLDDAILPTLPEVVVKARRKKRAYLNHILSRGCVGSSYSACRQLWVRVRRGEYELNPDALLRVSDGDGRWRWQPVAEVFGLSWLRGHHQQVTARLWREYQAKWKALQTPFTKAQLAAAAAMAPGVGVHELMTLRYTLASPLPEDATPQEREQRRGLAEAMAAIESGRIGPWRLTSR